MTTSKKCVAVFFIFILILLLIDKIRKDKYVSVRNEEMQLELKEIIQKGDFKTFTFILPQGGINITANYSVMKEAYRYDERNQYYVTLDPPINGTDGNLYCASLQCMLNIFSKYHRQKGLFFLDSAEVKYDEIYKKNVAYWKLPTGKGLYVLSMVSSEDHMLRAFIIYLK